MIDAIHISESGLKSTQKWLDNLSNNIANMYTTGFKKTDVGFLDVVSNSVVTNNAQSNNSYASLSGLGTKLSTPVIDMSSGPLKATSNALDMAVNGSGLFEVVLDDGRYAYTRVGNMQINQEGLLSIGGYALSDQIHIPADIEEIKINKDGRVVGIYTGEELDIELGQIRLAMVNNTSALVAMGEGFYTVDYLAGEVMLHEPGQAGTGEIAQGFLEMSNVNLVDEMTNIMLAQRAYQLNARLIQTADQILETVNNLRR